MKLKPESRHRHSIRLKGYDYSQAGGYYLTIVSYQREPLFGEILNGEVQINPLGTIVQDCWLEIPTHFPHVVLDAFVVMPNHIHGILFIHNVNEVGARHVSPLQKRHVSPLQKGYTPPSSGGGSFNL
jgi:putative transposase